MHIKAERTTLEEEKRKKDKIGRCYILHSLFIRLGVQILLNAGEKYSEREMDGRLGSHSKLCFLCCYRLKPQETAFICRRGSRIISEDDHRDVSSEIHWLLPDNIWLHIFSYLSLRQRFQASYTCRRWNNLCKDSLFWREVDFSFCSSQRVTDDTVRAVTSYAIGIQSIDFSGDQCESITDKAIGHVARFCQRLQKLNISGRERVTNRGLTLIARNCPLLKELNVEKCEEISDKGIKSIAKNCRRLKVLSLASCSKISDKGVRFIAKKCTNLQSLNIAGCGGVSDTSLMTIGKHCHSLRNINLKEITGISFYGIESLVSGNPGMTHVRLGIVGDAQNTMIALQIIVKHCQKLQFLSFQHFHKTGVVAGGVQKMNKKRLGAFINSLNACVFSNENR